MLFFPLFSSVFPSCLRCTFRTTFKLLLSLLVVSSTAALAQDTSSVFDDVHELVNQRFIDLVGDLDDLFGGEASQDLGNQSWARLRLGVTGFESDSPDLRGNIKLKLVLPNTEKRLQLLLSTEDQDTLDAGEARGQGLTTEQQDNVSLALRFLQSVQRQSSFKFDLGARVRDDRAQAFVRFNTSRKFLVNGGDEKRDLALINNLWYFSESGYENRLRLVYRQHLSLSHIDFIQSISQITWQEDQRGAGLVQNFAAFHKLNDRTFLGVEGILDSVSSPEPGDKVLTSIESRWRFRQNIWRDWFYYEVIPRIRWEDDRDFSARYGIQLQVEAFLGRLGDRVAITK